MKGAAPQPTALSGVSINSHSLALRQYPAGRGRQRDGEGGVRGVAEGVRKGEMGREVGFESGRGDRF